MLDRLSEQVTRGVRGFGSGPARSARPGRLGQALCGDHKPGHRRRVLTEFADGIATDGTVVEKGYLGSVKVLGEGVDTKNCDSVYFADVRGSMPDLVQAVGPGATDAARRGEGRLPRGAGPARAG